MILEDEGIIAMEMKLQLLNSGFSVAPIAISGKGAISIAEEYKPCVMLLDINVRGSIDGIEAAVNIREFSGAAIIFVTGQADEHSKRRMEQIENSTYFIKPVTISDLTNKINEMLLVCENN